MYYALRTLYDSYDVDDMMLLCDLVMHFSRNKRVLEEIKSLDKKVCFTIPYFKHEDFDFDVFMLTAEHIRVVYENRGDDFDFETLVDFIIHANGMSLSNTMIKNNLFGYDNLLEVVEEDPSDIEAFAFPCPETEFYKSLPMARTPSIVVNLIETVSLDEETLLSDVFDNIEIRGYRYLEEDTDDEEEDYEDEYSRWQIYIGNHLLRYRF